MTLRHFQKQGSEPQPDNRIDPAHIKACRLCRDRIFFAELTTSNGYTVLPLDLIPNHETGRYVLIAWRIERPNPNLSKYIIADYRDEPYDPRFVLHKCMKGRP